MEVKIYVNDVIELSDQYKYWKVAIVCYFTEFDRRGGD